MKKLTLILIAFISLSFVVVNDSNIPNVNGIEQSSNKVYICGGKYATKYHSHSSCRGLNNCKAEIYYYESQQEAINNGYSYCLICWN